MFRGGDLRLPPHSSFSSYHIPRRAAMLNFGKKLCRGHAPAMRLLLHSFFPQEISPNDISEITTKRLAACLPYLADMPLPHS